MSPFEFWCENVAGEIAGREIETMSDLITYKDIPPVLRMALNGILTGLYIKIK